MAPVPAGQPVRADRVGNLRYDPLTVIVFRRVVMVGGCSIVEEVRDDFSATGRPSQNARFDGWFVVAVLTTGIYVRPLRAMSGLHATAAFRGGFGANGAAPRRSRNVRSDVVARAMRLMPTER